MAKRALDLVLGSLAALMLLPVIAAIAILVRVRLGSPVFFHQTRPGLHGRLFQLVKFRTMTDATSSSGAPLADRDRLTPLGRVLRSWSLDELPELWNVLRGEMSLVGPRPLLPEYLALYTAEQARRHEVPPGMTGWAQVNGRNALTWEEKFALDVWYVDHRSAWLDVKILFMTVAHLVRPSGIGYAGEETMPKFTGRSTEIDVR